MSTVLIEYTSVTSLADNPRSSIGYQPLQILLMRDLLKPLFSIDQLHIPELDENRMICMAGCDSW